MTRILFLLIPGTVCLLSCNGNKDSLNETIRMDDYPSASGIEYYQNQFYIIGDDASKLVILGSNFITLDSVSLYSATEKRIPKAVKADLEAITLVNDHDTTKLLLTGSGSLSPHRNTAWLINPATRQKDSMRLDTFYQRLQASGIEEINIEGACAAPGFLLLSNRGHKGYRKNQLIFTKNGFWRDQQKASLNIVKIGFNADTAVFNGISGIAYAAKSDRLVLTVSTEDTRSTTGDGAIGKSYLWLVDNISSKQNWTAINPNKIIDLEAISVQFNSQKIESVCITEETTEKLELVLAADNDDGTSTLFRVTVHL